MMNPYLAQRLAAEHARELCAQAPDGRPRAGRPAPRGSVRRRAGWTLVTIGLRLAATPDHG